MGGNILKITDYNVVGDVCTVVLCFISLLVLILNRVRKNKSALIVLGMVLNILAAAWMNMTYHVLLTLSPLPMIWLYITRFVNHFCLSTVQVLYIMYLREPFWIKHSTGRGLFVFAAGAAVLPFMLDVAGSIAGFGYRVEGNEIITGLNFQALSFAVFEILVLFLIIRYRNRIISQFFHGLITVNLLSTVLITMQGIFHQQSFTTISHFLPVITLMLIFHPTPYDSEMGTVIGDAFYSEITGYMEKNVPLLLVSCRIEDFTRRLKGSGEMKEAFLRFFKQNIRNGVLYRLSSEHFIMVFKKQKKANYARILYMMLDNFDKYYEEFNMDYRIIICDSCDSLKTGEDYVKLFEYIEGNMKMNTKHRVLESDIEAFLGSRSILGQLEDIARKQDLSDERVLVYCQPVFNISSGTYDTAEALMRLKLPELGLVFPDKFIPLAESSNTIHTLSLIILNKTCAMIKRFLEEGLNLGRISVNFSAIDLRQEDFCAKVQKIISENGIPYGKIAVEITESRSEPEFNMIKQKVIELQSLGIKFYLDDFGTGYSNFERIMELPFDIIKFDRSLLMESVKDDNSRFMVSTFAGMFSDLDYSVLFEGVEDERDEMQCVGMHASYLQGYKYSKPIPIEDLRNFLEKEAVNA